MEDKDTHHVNAQPAQRRSRSRLSVYTASTALLGGLAVGGLAFSHSGGGTTLAAASPSVHTSIVSSSTSIVSRSTAVTQPKIGASGRGFNNGFGFGRHGGGLTVVSVGSSTITATGRGGQTTTIDVTSSTTYSEAGKTITLSDIKAGDHLAVQGSRSTTTSTTINATGVTVVLPQVAGVVTGVGSGTLTLTSFDGATKTVIRDSDTTYTKADQTATAEDVTTGTSIVAEGRVNADGSLAAVRVTIQVPRIAGQVASVGSGSYTVTGFNGTSYTVTTSTSTRYVNADGSTASTSAIKQGSGIMAEGSLSADGKTLTALEIRIMPVSSNGQPGFGFRGRDDQDSTSSTSTVPAAGSSSAASGTGV